VDVAMALGRRIAVVGLGLLDYPNIAAAQFTIGRDAPDPIFIQVQNTPTIDEVIVRVNSNHPISPPPPDQQTATFGYCDIAPIVENYFDSDLKKAIEFADTIAATLLTAMEK
jgi:hypothetical protein